MQEERGEGRAGQDLHDVPLSALGLHALEPLYALLNPEKVLPSPDGQPRDWRGLAELAQIPGQYHSSIRDCVDFGGSTAKVLNLWMQQKDGSDTVGHLQEYLQMLDRWDIYDDTKDLFEKEAERYRQQLRRPVPAVQNGPDERITYDDLALHPKLQHYHAYVLYAKEDSEFAQKLMDRLRNQGFKICSEADLLVGFTTQFEPVSRLLSDRCQHVIVIFSPDFLDSPANKFHMDYAQALGIETRTRKMVPCMYRKCRVPISYSFYHMLYYNEGHTRSMYNFWEKLAKSLEMNSDLPRCPVAEGAANRIQGALPALAPAPASVEQPAAPAPQLATPSTESPPPPTKVSQATPPNTPQVPSSTASQVKTQIGHEVSGNLPSLSDLSQLSITAKKPTILQKIFKKKLKKNKAKELMGLRSECVL